MLKELLQPKVEAFIRKHENSNFKALDRLLLSKSKFPNIPIKLVIDQIRARNKAKDKLPLWYHTKGVIMPPLLSVEQSSSEEMAKYKAQYFLGELAIDLTGGAGIDCYYLSKKFREVIYVDFNKELAAIAKHNFNKLGATNIKVVCENSASYIHNFKGLADLIFIDPARRNHSKKLFLLQDCSPNLLDLQQTILKKSCHTLIKASPMLDINKAVEQLSLVYQVHVVALKNEVKELLFMQSNITTKEIEIVAEDLARGFKFCTTWKKEPSILYSQPLTYLYEPNAAILKTGKVNVLIDMFKVAKLNLHTHLFTSQKILKNFPGRIFKIQKIIKYDKKELKAVLPNMKANIAIRNFPDSVEIFRKKTKIKEGGSIYLFGVRDMDNKIKVLLCSKI